MPENKCEKCLKWEYGCELSGLARKNCMNQNYRFFKPKGNILKIDKRCKPLIERFIGDFEKCKCGIISHEYKVNKMINWYKKLIA